MTPTLRAKDLQTIRLGKETAPGTAVDPTDVLPNTQIAIGAAGDPNDEYMAEGHLFYSDMASGLEWGAGTWQAPPTYDESYVPFNSLFGHVDPVAGDLTATATITVTTQPDPADSLVVGGKTFTFVSSAPGTNDILIGADTTATATAIKNKINAATVACLCTAASALNVVSLTANAAGAAGNSITLTRTGTHLTLVTFAGGGDGTGTAQIRTWLPQVAAADVHDTYTTQRGMAGAVRQFASMVFNTLKLVVSKRVKPLMSGNVLSQEMSLIDDFTGSPDTVHSSPVPRTKFDIYYADNWADCVAGTDTLLAIAGANLEFDFGPVVKDAAFIGSASQTFDALGAIAVANSMKLTLPFDVSGSDFAGLLTLAAKREATPIFLRVVALGKLLDAPAVREKFEMIFSLKVRTVPSDQDIDAVFLGMQWTLGLFIDGVSGNVLRVQTISSTT